MISFLARRLGALLLLLWLVTLITFGMTLLIPGDPAIAILGDSATPESIAAVQEAMGLNKPPVERYWTWLSGAATGDLGTSLFSSYTVHEAIATRIPVTISLVLLSLVVSFVVGVGAGSFLGTRPGTKLDRSVMFISAASIALPNFWLGILVVTLFGVILRWFPVGGYVPLADDPGEWLHRLALPVLTLAVGGIAELVRQTRASMIDTLRLDYIRALRAKGVPPFTIHYRHALRNSMIPIVTVTGLLVSRLFGLSILIESVFNLPGVGSLMIRSVFDRDIPMMQGVVLVITVMVVTVNLIVDVLYGILNPKAAAK